MIEQPSMAADLAESARAAAVAQALAAADLAYSDPAQARRSAEAALASAPGDVEVATAAQRALGMAASASGDLAAAAQGLRRAAELAESAGLSIRAGQARGSLAYVLLLTIGAKDALRELDRADAVLADGVPAARLQMQRGLILSEIRSFAEAGASLDRALDTLARAGGDDLLEADIRNNRAIVSLGIRDWAGAHEELRRAEELYASGGHLGRTAMVYHNRGIVDASRGDLPGALGAFDEAGQRYQRAGLHSGLLSVDRAEALLAARLVAEARTAAESAVDEFTRQRNSVDIVQARLLLAEAALLDGDVATARIEADHARRLARRQGRPRWAALAGYLRLQAGRRSGGQSALTLRAGARVAHELGEAGWVVQSLDARLIVARAALTVGRPDVARAQLVGVRTARRTGPAQLRVRAWHAEAIVRRFEGDQAGAARAVRAGLDILDQFQASLGATDLRAHAFAHAADLATLGLELAVASGRPASILAAAERGRAGALRFRPARPPDDAELAGELAELRQVVSELNADEVADTGALLTRQRALERAIRDRARHAVGSYAAPARAPSRAALLQVLGRSTLVEYFELDGDLHAVALGLGQCTRHRLGSVAKAAGAVDSLRGALRWLALGVGSARALATVTDVVDRRARELDDFLLRPVRVGAPDTPLVIVPTGVLHTMPWSVLPSCLPRAVSVAPSAAQWYRAATDQKVSNGSIVLAHGPGLQHASAEVRALGEIHRNAIALTAAEAQVGPLLAALDGARVAHLAAHGHFRADNPMFSELRFADGPLTVYDLERLDVPPRLVVLASCDSGLASVSSGDELVGLAAAMLALGSVSLIAAVIPVPDEGSSALMTRLHVHLAAGTSAAEALRRARVEITSSAGTTTSAAAAGFVCFGAG